MIQEWTIPLRIHVTVGDPVQEAPTPAAAAAPPPSGGIPLLAAPADRGAEERAEIIPHLDKFAPSSLREASFNYSTALSLALAAKLVYADPATVRSTVEDTWRLTNFEFFDIDETQCFVATTPDAALVSFRGTASLGDWMTNLNLLTTTLPYGTVHRGFLGAFQSVRMQLEAVLDRVTAGGRRLVLTGHSLGGALALIAAVEWRDKYPVSWVHTCGQPAVGHRNFLATVEARYGDTYCRFVNDDDIVPMVPPTFKHTGRLIHFAGADGLESAMVSEERKALNLGGGPVMEETPVMEPKEFDLMRAQLLQHRALQGAGALGDAAVQEAAKNAVTAFADPHTEGFLGFPSVADHNMSTYVKKIAREAGFQE
jgi:hypothetical protein